MNSSTVASLRRRSTAALSIVALVGVAVLTGCDSGSSGDQSAVAGAPASPASAPTDDPTDQPTDDPTDEPSDEPTDEPSDDSTDTPDSGSPITAAEYSDDWNFRLGDVKMSAKHVRGTDYPSCSQLEVKNSLTSRGCEYGVKVTYRTNDGTMMFTNMILEMKNEAKATKFSHDTTLKYSDFNYGEGDVIPNFNDGQWRARSAGKYVVFTIATGDSSTNLKKVKKLLHYANADFTSALLWR